MKQYIKDYIKEEEKLLDKNITKKDIDDLLIKISFFSHERLVHLIVMMFCILFSLLFLIISFSNSYFIFAYILTLILSAFYIFHYFFLENSIQYLYKLYDKFNNK